MLTCIESYEVDEVSEKSGSNGNVGANNILSRENISPGKHSLFLSLSLFVSTYLCLGFMSEGCLIRRQNYNKKRSHWQL